MKSIEWNYIDKKTPNIRTEKVKIVKCIYYWEADVFEDKNHKISPGIESNIYIQNESRKEYLEEFIDGNVNLETFYYPYYRYNISK